MSPMMEPLEDAPVPRRKEVSVECDVRKKKKTKRKTPVPIRENLGKSEAQGMAPEAGASESTDNSTVLISSLVDAAIQPSEIIHFSSACTFINMVDMKFDRGGRAYFVEKPKAESETDVEKLEPEKIPMNLTDPKKEWTRMYEKVVEYDSDGDEIPDGAFSDSEDDESDHTEPVGSNGFDLPLLTMPGQEGAQNLEHAVRQTPRAKTQKSARTGRRSRWRNRKNLARFNLKTGMIEREGNNFEDYTVRELREAVNARSQDFSEEPKVELEWFDDDEDSVTWEKDANKSGDKDMLLWEVEETAELLNMGWRSESQTWEDKKWVKVDSVMDSGAAAPVAPPSMMPNVKIEPSPGSVRGQHFTSASSHKLKNLGQQRIHACTEDGEETSVLFQIADVSKPLVSVASICEKGNRVIFGKSGGVVQNVYTGRRIPFYRRNGIYILSLWLMDNEQDFPRP